MRILFSMSMVLAIGLLAGSASATVIVNEDFEGYANTAAMQVNWGAAGVGVLDTGFGNGGQSVQVPAGAGTNNIWQTGFSISPPTVGNAIVLTADIYDDGNSSNERRTVGLRGGPFPIFEMGHYNSPSHYSARINGMYGTPDWVQVAPQSAAPRWNRWKVVFQEWQVTVTLDLNADGTIDATYNKQGEPSLLAFSDLRFGGPSGASSAAGGIHVDNIKLESNVVIPEPASLTLLGFAAMGMFVRRRR